MGYLLPLRGRTLLVQLSLAEKHAPGRDFRVERQVVQVPWCGLFAQHLLHNALKQVRREIVAEVKVSVQRANACLAFVPQVGRLFLVRVVQPLPFLRFDRQLFDFFLEFLLGDDPPFEDLLSHPQADLV